MVEWSIYPYFDECLVHQLHFSVWNVYMKEDEMTILMFGQDTVCLQTRQRSFLYQVILHLPLKCSSWQQKTTCFHSLRVLTYKYLHTSTCVSCKLWTNQSNMKCKCCVCPHLIQWFSLTFSLTRLFMYERMKLPIWGTKNNKIKYINT